MDVTVTPSGLPNKLRMGGIAHAARGFWAHGRPFAVAAVLPTYLESSARKYLESLGCAEFHILGDVSGCPNVTLIFDPTEVSDQEYDNLLRDEKVVAVHDLRDDLKSFEDILVFPGNFDLAQACSNLSASAKLHIDPAYDVESVDALRKLKRAVSTVFLSTSSRLFLDRTDGTLDGVASYFAPLHSDVIVLKENRGGARIRTRDGSTVHIPAKLDKTVNSVGVGDVFDAAFLIHTDQGPHEAGFRAASASSAYAQTTFPDLFRTYVERDLAVSVEMHEKLGGVQLPWEARADLHIYLAAPDFSYADRTAIERAIAALSYHGFTVRRPIQENGELPLGSSRGALQHTYARDVALLHSCALVFAVPTDRDPGTLVEVGMALERGIPVITYDPTLDCTNTMVIAGSEIHSDDLDACLNATFTALSRANING